MNISLRYNTSKLDYIIKKYCCKISGMLWLENASSLHAVITAKFTEGTYQETNKRGAHCKEISYRHNSVLSILPLNS